MARTEWKFNWVKPLKRSEKVRLRKELEKRKKEENLTLKETNFKEDILPAILGISSGIICALTHALCCWAIGGK